jgi:hypothetical protein
MQLVAALGNAQSLIGRWMMQSLLVQRWGALVVAVCLFSATMTQPAVAGVISTETAIELTNRQLQIDRINNVFAQENVRNMLVRMGVDPAYASTRVDALTNEELQTMEQNLANLPAGGVGALELVGIIAIVLLVLELLEVTNFFEQF